MEQYRLLLMEDTPLWVWKARRKFEDRQTLAFGSLLAAMLAAAAILFYAGLAYAT